MARRLFNWLFSLLLFILPCAVHCLTEQPCRGILPQSCACSDQVINCVNVTGVSLNSLPNITVNFPRLISLHLSGNKFEYLEKDVFKLRGANWNLKQLDLSNNAIVDISEQCFVNLPELQQLKLANNNISFRIRPYVPGRRVGMTGSFLTPLTSNLQDLNLAGAFNRDETSQPAHFEFNLATVNLFNPEDNFHALEYLNLSDNGLLHLPPNIFQGMPALQFLYLSNNKLETFEMEAIDADRLTQLHLQSNLIQRVNESFMQMVESRQPLKAVYLAGNPFICDCQSQTFIDWAIKSPKVADREKILCSMSIDGHAANRSLNFAAMQLKCGGEKAANSNQALVILCSVAAIALASMLLWLLYANKRLLCRNAINVKNWLAMNAGGYEILESENTRTRAEVVAL